MRGVEMSVNLLRDLQKRSLTSGEGSFMRWRRAGRMEFWSEGERGRWDRAVKTAILTSGFLSEMWEVREVMSVDFDRRRARIGADGSIRWFGAADRSSVLMETDGSSARIEADGSGFERRRASFLALADSLAKKGVRDEEEIDLSVDCSRNRIWWRS